MAKPELQIGCSGFNYAHWRGTFYPEKLAQRLWFSHYISVFACVELNVTFYRLLPRKTFEKWYAETPAGFRFAVKGSRFLTHIKRLDEPEEALGRFFESVLALGEKLSAVLWQLPPQFGYDRERLERFLTCCSTYPVRHVFEFRNESWLNDEVVELCTRHKAALCIADAPPFLNDPPRTADFIYIRRHGIGGYQSLYTPDELAADAARIRGFLDAGQGVQIYFNNDYMGYAPRNAQELITLLADRF